MATKLTRECIDAPKATHMGQLDILDHPIPCAVLEDGRRVLSDRGMRAALGLKMTGARKNAGENGSLEMPPFLAKNNLKPFVSKDFTVRSISYQPAGGGPRVQGYEAGLLPRVCQVYLAARRAGALHKSQEHIAAVCEILLGALAETGITALVDEATGYQSSREQDALRRVLNRYLRDRFAEWTLTFERDFYKELFALRGWKWNPANPSCGPRYLAALTKDLIYERLAPGVLEELERRNPVVTSAEGARGREHKHHQWLTEDVGRRDLREHLHLVTRLMRIYPDWHQFHRALDRACPKHTGSRVQLDFGDLPGIEMFD